jgi:hypothetical protein
MYEVNLACGDTASVRIIPHIGAYCYCIHCDSRKKVVSVPGLEENRTKHTLWYVAIQMKTYRFQWSGSVQVPGFFVEASTPHEAQTKALDIIKTCMRYSNAELGSATVQAVEASLLWKN